MDIHQDRLNYRMQKKLVTERRAKQVKSIKVLLYLIPLLIIFFLLYSNLFVNKEFDYFYDLGYKTKNYLSPERRVSVSSSNDNYVNVTADLVYFSVPVSKSAESTEIYMRFRDTLQDGKPFNIGGRDRSKWHYEWKTIYQKGLENLSLYSHSQDVYTFNNKPISKEKIHLAQGLVISSQEPIQKKPYFYENFMMKNYSITTPLRGAHEFYLYTQGDLKIKILKRDINWYNGPDNLTISVYSLNDTLLKREIIPDDGDLSNSKVLGQKQSKTLQLENLSEGVYRLSIGNFDGLITEINTNTPKIIAINKVYLANSDLFIESPNSASLYTLFIRQGQVSFKTWHKQGLQIVSVDESHIGIREIDREFNLDVINPGLSHIEVSKGDVIVSVPGYLAFSESSYFEPLKNRVVPIKNDVKWLSRNVDYLVSEYNLPQKDEDWFIGKVSFNIDDLYIRNNRLDFVISIPSLGSNSSVGVPIDWIAVKINKNQLFP